MIQDCNDLDCGNGIDLNDFIHKMEDWLPFSVMMIYKIVMIWIVVMG